MDIDTKIIMNWKMCQSIALSAMLRVQNNDRTTGQEWISPTTTFCKLPKIHCNALGKSWAMFCSSHWLYEWLHNIALEISAVHCTGSDASN